PENVPEKIVHIAAFKVIFPLASIVAKALTAPMLLAFPGALAAVKCGMAKLVVQLLLLLVAEYIVSLCDFLKLPLRLRIACVGVRMILLRPFSICFFDRPGVCVSAYSQDIIVISFLCHIITTCSMCNITLNFNDVKQAVKKTALL